MRDLIDDGTIKIIFIKSEDNDADIFTKNVSEELFNKHTSKNIDDLYNKEEQGFIIIDESNLMENDFNIII